MEVVRRVDFSLKEDAEVVVGTSRSLLQTAWHIRIYGVFEEFRYKDSRPFERNSLASFLLCRRHPASWRSKSRSEGQHVTDLLYYLIAFSHDSP